MSPEQNLPDASIALQVVLTPAEQSRNYAIAHGWNITPDDEHVMVPGGVVVTLSRAANPGIRSSIFPPAPIAVSKDQQTILLFFLENPAVALPEHQQGGLSYTQNRVPLPGAHPDYNWVRGHEPWAIATPMLPDPLPTMPEQSIAEVFAPAVPAAVGAPSPMDLATVLAVAPSVPPISYEIDRTTVEAFLARLSLNADAPVEIAVGLPQGGMTRKAYAGRAAAIAALPAESTGVYAQINAFTNATGKSGGVTDADILRRRWLVVDMDPNRPSKTSATEAQVKAALEIAESVRQHLEEAGFGVPMMVNSGNGRHLYYAINLPADSDLPKRILMALNAKVGRAGVVKIDATVASASRIMRLPGTANGKGLHTAETPHRRVEWLNPKHAPAVVPQSVLEAWLAANELSAAPAPEKHKAKAKRSSAPVRTGEPAHGATPREEVETWLAKQPPAIAGQGGHNATYAVAVGLAHGWELPAAEAFELMRAQYNNRCVPPWTDAELQHKVEDAASKPHARPRGWLRGKPVREFVLPDAQPLTLARSYLDNLDGTELVRWRGLFYRCLPGNQAFQEASDEELRADIYRHLERCACPKRGGKEDAGMVPISPGLKLGAEVIGAILAARETGILLLKHKDAPMWRDGRDEDGGPDPRHLVPCKNGLYCLETREFMPLDPQFFCLGTSDFEYAADAPPPAEWMKFLDSVFAHDADARLLLQEWFGYCLGHDISRQKILMIVGPKRAGKGIIAQVLRALLGSSSVAAPTLSGLTQQFGRASLIGTRLALIGDARLGNMTDQSALAEVLLNISGGDPVEIQRKHRESWNGRLTTRIMLTSNETPRLTDASGALASRFMFIVLEKTFYNNEDLGLETKLMMELPGIFNWAVEGWARLCAQKRFTVPKSSLETQQELEEICSPVAKFINSYCQISAEGRCSAPDLFSAWRIHADNEGFQAGSVGMFGRNLKAAFPHIRKIEGSDHGLRKTFYGGISLLRRPMREHERERAVPLYVSSPHGLVPLHQDWSQPTFPVPGPDFPSPAASAPPATPWVGVAAGPGGYSGSGGYTGGGYAAPMGPTNPLQQHSN